VSPLRLILPLLACLAIAVPATAGAGAGLSAVIQTAEQLRGLQTTHPIAVSAVGAAGMRRVVVGELAHEREPRSDAAWNEALHLLGVLGRGQTLAAVQRQQLSGQVAGVYVPRDGRLYVLASGGEAPRSVIVHEVVHALQDEHFHLTRGPFAARPRDHDAELAATSLVEGDATEVHERYVAGLSPGDLVGELARALGAAPSGDGAHTPAYLERQLLFPYTAGDAFVKALRARGGQRLLDRAFAHPPRTTAAVLDPARYLAGDPPARAVPLPVGSYAFTTTFGAEDVAALTGQDALARGWLGGRMGVGSGGLELRLATRSAAAVAAALRKVLPAAARVASRGLLVCVQIARENPSVQGLSCR
jgi:hypothetical protein